MIKISKLESTVNEEKIRYNRVSNYFNEFLEKSNRSIEKVSLDDIDKFIDKYLLGEARVSLYYNIKCLNDILLDRNINIRVNSSDYINKLKFNSGKYFTKREIQQLCRVFSNSQDRFIVYALWNGIMGKDYTDLVNLKVSDIVKDEIGTPLYINVSGRKVKCDEFMQKIISYVLEDNIYYQYTESADKSYELNMQSEYVIKIRPSKKTNDGLNPMNKVGIQTRLTKLSNVFEGEFGDIKIHLTGKSLERSGLMYIMYELQIRENKAWKIDEIKKWFKEQGLKGHIPEIYRVYHKKYNNI